LWRVAALSRDEWMTYVVVPAAVSRAIGRGRAPVEARIGRGAALRVHEKKLDR
jgi:Domain of unknown function (DUF1905)